MLEIKRYQPQLEQEWNDFVRRSKNGTFLFDRQYMDYHQDRFTDCSLMIYQNNRLIALFPANKTQEGVVHSHQGLTYGGLLLSNKATTHLVLQCFADINQYYKEAGCHKIVYKTIPHIYHRLPSEEDLYALFKECRAELVGRDIASVITPQTSIGFAELRRRGVKKAIQQGITIQPATRYAPFWQILAENLQGKYGVSPVHTLEEIELLASRFPDNIKLYTAEKEGQVIAGVVIYETDTTIHVQYISANAVGKATGALDLLFHHLIQEIYCERKFFDFGRSTEDRGHTLNQSLIFQKEGFGGRGICYDMYEWTL